MTRARSTEEPCAAKVACTVLESSGGSDPLAEFNRALRPVVLWRKASFGTQNLIDSDFSERLLTVIATLRQQQRDILEYVATACEVVLHHHLAPSLLPQTEVPSGRDLKEAA